MPSLELVSKRWWSLPLLFLLIVFVSLELGWPGHAHHKKQAPAAAPARPELSQKKKQQSSSAVPDRKKKRSPNNSVHGAGLLDRNKLLPLLWLALPLHGRDKGSMLSMGVGLPQAGCRDVLLSLFVRGPLVGSREEDHRDEGVPCRPDQVEEAQMQNCTVCTASLKPPGDSNETGFGLGLWKLWIWNLRIYRKLNGDKHKSERRD